MSQYIPFTEEEKLRAGSADIAELLRDRGEEVRRSGKELVWIRDGEKISIRGNLWFNQYRREGGNSIDFARKFLNFSYPDAVKLLLGESREGAVLSSSNRPRSVGQKKQAQKPFTPPKKHHDMKRVFSYHGAEHKTIRCYEARLPLTVENVRVQTRLHPRCGTSFLLVVMLLSILIFSIASSVLLALVPALAALKGGFLYKLLMILFKLLLLPLVVSISYEINRWVGRHDNALTRVLTAPGLWLQHLTTREPDDSMIEVGIAALEAVLPEVEGSDRW